MENLQASQVGSSFPVTTEKEAVESEAEKELAKYLKWSRVEAALSPSFIERQSKISGALECREPLWEMPLSSRRTPQVRFQSVTRVASVEAAFNRFQAFLNVSEPMAGCDLTPGATVSSRGVKYQARNR